MDKNKVEDADFNKFQFKEILKDKTTIIITDWALCNWVDFDSLKKGLPFILVDLYNKIDELKNE